MPPLLTRVSLPTSAGELTDASPVLGVRAANVCFLAVRTHTILLPAAGDECEEKGMPSASDMWGCNRTHRHITTTGSAVAMNNLCGRNRNQS